MRPRKERRKRTVDGFTDSAKNLAFLDGDPAVMGQGRDKRFYQLALAAHGDAIKHFQRPVCGLGPGLSRRVVRPLRSQQAMHARVVSVSGGDRILMSE